MDSRGTEDGVVSELTQREHEDEKSSQHLRKKLLRRATRGMGGKQSAVLWSRGEGSVCGSEVNRSKCYTHLNKHRRESVRLSKMII